MTADEMQVDPVVLEGIHVRLQPLSRKHTTGLCEVGLEEQLWRWIPTPVRTPDDMAAYVELALKEQANGVSLPFAQIEKAGRVIGSTRYMNRDRVHVDRARVAAHGRKHRGEILAAKARVRNAGLHARGTEDGFLERQIPSCDSTDRREGGGDFPESHDHVHWADPAYRVFQR